MKKSFLLLIFILAAQTVVFGQKITKEIVNRYGNNLYKRDSTLKTSQNRFTEQLLEEKSLFETNRMMKSSPNLNEGSQLPQLIEIEIDPNVGVTRPSFQKIYKTDFSSVVGINDLPVNQVTIGVNKPEIKIGTNFFLYEDSTKSLPWGALFPYVKGKQNDDGEYQLFGKGKFDPTANYGVQVILFPSIFKIPTYQIHPKRRADATLASNKLLLAKLVQVVDSNAINKSIGIIDEKIKAYEAQILRMVNKDDIKKDSLLIMINAGYNQIDSLKKIKNNPGKYVRDKMYEKEKETVYSKKSFFWVAIDMNRERIKTNLYKNQKILEDEIFNKNVFGLSVNYTKLLEKSAFTGFVKLDFSRKNAFLSGDKINFVRDSIMSGSTFIAEKQSLQAFDVSDANFDLDKKATEKILKFSATYLRGEDKKKGISFMYENNLGTNITNLKLGFIFPVILNNSKAEQSNIIIEGVLPDIGTNGKNSKPNLNGLFDRSYINIKVGLPINIL